MRKVVALITVVLSISISAIAGVGDSAPDFTKNTLDHGQFSMSAQNGKVVYIFFVGYS